MVTMHTPMSHTDARKSVVGIWPDSKAGTPRWGSMSATTTFVRNESPMPMHMLKKGPAYAAVTAISGKPASAATE